jgi:hypothetical protein
MVRDRRQIVLVRYHVTEPDFRRDSSADCRRPGPAVQVPALARACPRRRNARPDASPRDGARPVRARGQCAPRPLQSPRRHRRSESNPEAPCLIVPRLYRAGPARCSRSRRRGDWRGRLASTRASHAGVGSRVRAVTATHAHQRMRLGSPRERCRRPLVSRATRGRVTKTRDGPRTRVVGCFFFVTTPRRAGTLLRECGSPIG